MSVLSAQRLVKRSATDFTFANLKIVILKEYVRNIAQKENEDQVMYGHGCFKD